MLCPRLSRPSLVSLVAAGLLAPSRGIAVCGGTRACLFFSAGSPHRPSPSAPRQQRQRRLPPARSARVANRRGPRASPSCPSSSSSSLSSSSAPDEERGQSGTEQQRQGGGSGAGGAADPSHGDDGGIGGGGDNGLRPPRPVSSSPTSPSLTARKATGAAPGQPKQVRTRRHRGRQGSGWGGDGDGPYGGDSRMSPEEQEREAQAVQGAVALAAARRGTGERERLVASESPVEEFVVRGRRVLVKRDDKMRLAESGLSGNKARKLYALNKTPARDFPKIVASHGGPQSNAMVAIAAVVASKPGSSFIYYTKPVPRWLRKNPVGNFAKAIMLGAEIMEVHTNDYKRIFGGTDGPGAAACAEVVPSEALFLPQGGADAAAEEGVSMLADEIIDYWDENGPPGKELRVVLPAGTGTTALFLARYLVPEGIPVYTVPCAGDSGYLQRQMAKVDRESGGVGIFPQFVQQNRRKAAFGAPKIEFLEVWRELDKMGLFVDLLYAAPTWEVIMDSWENNQGKTPVSVTPGPAIDTEPQLMYVHCGGLEGVSSQLTRYKHLGLVQDGQLQ
ncbi:unnamed protein product [Scytosiphon promiscuus]